MSTQDKPRQARFHRTARLGLAVLLAVYFGLGRANAVSAQPGGDLPETAVQPDPGAAGLKPIPPDPNGPKVAPTVQPRPLPSAQPRAPRVMVVDVEALGPAKPAATPPQPRATDNWVPADRPRMLPAVPTPITQPPPPPVPPTLPPAVVSPWPHDPLQPPPPPVIAPPPDYAAPLEPAPAAAPPSHPWEAHTPLGEWLGRMFESVCTPYPDYQPRWRPVADSAFFVEAVRPETQVRLRWDGGLSATTPDRAEAFWARADGNGRGPNPAAAGPMSADTKLTYHDFSVYTEVAFGNTAVFLEAPYRLLYPQPFPDAFGFSDINVGTKTLLFDCDLFQVGFSSVSMRRQATLRRVWALAMCRWSRRCC
jgi:hypothetical protein